MRDFVAEISKRRLPTTSSAAAPSASDCEEGRGVSRFALRMSGLGCAIAANWRTGHAAPYSAAAITVIATDLDGTLLAPDGTLSSGAQEAVCCARAQGVSFVLASGRPAAAM